MLLFFEILFEVHYTHNINNINNIEDFIIIITKINMIGGRSQGLFGPCCGLEILPERWEVVCKRNEHNATGTDI